MATSILHVIVTSYIIYFINGGQNWRKLEMRQEQNLPSIEISNIGETLLCQEHFALDTAPILCFISKI